jgi:protein-S-isoprenylcysteine O-methyltransferase Ste14
MNSKILIRYIIRETMGLVVMGVALFWSAGTLNWWPAWAALAVMALWSAGTAAVILLRNPELLAERLGPRKGAKSWDLAIMGSLGMIQLARYIVAGLDHRYGWSGEFPVMAQIAALIAGGLGYALMVWSTSVNAFFSQIVRIQTEKGHSVVTSGPYRYVRHPGYFGALIFELTIGILLGSWWVFGISLFGAFLLVLRTSLEDLTLQKELPGYTDYTRKVRYRLAPGIW